MAAFKTVWITVAAVTLLVLGKVTLDESSSRLVLQESHESAWLPHTRQRRNALESHEEYEVDVELNVTDIRTLEQIQSLLRSISDSLTLSSDVNVTNLEITTVCSPNGSDFVCRCEAAFAWSGEDCATYGACSETVNDTCTCISSLPSDGRHCQPRNTTAAAAVYEYQILVEVNTTLLSQLRNSLNAVFPLEISSHVNISDAVITTVCSPSSDGFQCRCEDEYRWSCDQCQTHRCDNVTGNACGCVSGIPAGGPFCQSVAEHTDQEQYEVFLELNVTDARLIRQVRSLLRDGLPLRSRSFQISAIDISAVCSPSSGEFRCVCEDRYRWSCDQCQRYESCDSLVNRTCGCIRGIPPEGAFCRSEDEHDFTECSTTTPTSTTAVTNTTDVTTLMTTTSVTLTTTSTPDPTTNTSAAAESPETNSTTVSTTAERTTRATAAPTTNSTTVSTTSERTTTVPAAPTTNSTTVSTTAERTTVTAAPTTNSTTVSTTSERTATVPAAPTTSTTTARSTTTVSSTKAPTTSTTVSSTEVAATIVTLSLSVTLDLTYTEDLANNESERYRSLSSRLNRVFNQEYRGITGFREAFVTGFRPGSVIVDFVIQTAAFSADEIRNINNNLPNALASIARVLGSVVAQYNSDNSLQKPDITFTTQEMTLTCGPPEVDLGMISDSEWRLDGLEIMTGRRQIKRSDNMSTLTVRNVIRADDGTYECTLKGESFNYFQRGTVPARAIRAAPVIQLRRRINVQCQVGRIEPLECCVQDPFEVSWRDLESESSAGCITRNYRIESCNQPLVSETFTCQVVDVSVEFRRMTTLTIFNSDPACDDTIYGQGRLGDQASARCAPNQQGTMTAECEERGWRLLEDTCILTQINELLIDSEDLSEERVPEFTERFRKTVQNASDDISQSPATINAVVQILNTIANVSTVISENVTENVLQIVDAIIGDNSRESWSLLNTNETRNTSSSLLNSLEMLADRASGIFAVETPLILFNRTTFNDSFMANLNSTVFVNIPQSDVSNVNITTITLPTLDNVMPTRNSFNFGSSTGNNTNETAIVINAAVVLIKVSDTISNVTLSYQKLNTSLEEEPQCVFWNFTLFRPLGAWDNQGCELLSQDSNTVTCTCNHLTSFSILMSTNIPEDIIVVLDVITYVGVGISMASLVICLIIEGYVWKDITRNSTAFMRHVSIINTALSLLIANICFIIGAAISTNESENPGEDHEVPLGPCSTATFFMHFFYLAMFFWMLVSGLLLFYRTVMVFSHMSKSTMLAIGFTLGYICPLLIAVVTVAATAPGRNYIRRDLACWLNWTETRALLAMVIPALVIVLINFVIVIVVLSKMLRRGVGNTSHTDEKHSLVIVIRCIAILTPLFGLTWGLGVGTMISPTNRGIHIAFAFFNSFQGFFILVFGTLLDSKIRALLSRRIPALSSGSHPTQSTSGGLSSLTGNNFLNRLRRNRNVYRVSEAANSNSNSSSASDTFINT